MIDPRELRIGNKFYMIGGTMVQTVFEIMDNTDRGKVNFNSENQRQGYYKLITVEENGNQYKPIEMEGIPLTKEWLERFGFHSADKTMPSNIEGAKGMWFKQVSGSQFITTNGGEKWELVHKEAGGKIVPTPCPQLKTVHQLQNLFFALTGTELTLKP